MKKMAQSTMSLDARRWEAEDDLRTLQRSQEITSTPKRLTAARTMAKKQMSALRKVTR